MPHRLQIAAPAAAGWRSAGEKDPNSGLQSPECHRCRTAMKWYESRLNHEADCKTVKHRFYAPSAAIRPKWMSPSRLGLSCDWLDSGAEAAIHCLAAGEITTVGTTCGAGNRGAGVGASSVDSAKSFFSRQFSSSRAFSLRASETSSRRTATAHL
jgi:hypothetical protein